MPKKPRLLQRQCLPRKTKVCHPNRWHHPNATDATPRTRNATNCHSANCSRTPVNPQPLSAATPMPLARPRRVYPGQTPRPNLQPSVTPTRGPDQPMETIETGTLIKTSPPSDSKSNVLRGNWSSIRASIARNEENCKTNFDGLSKLQDIAATVIVEPGPSTRFLRAGFDQAIRRAA